MKNKKNVKPKKVLAKNKKETVKVELTQSELSEKFFQNHEDYKTSLFRNSIFINRYNKVYPRDSNNNLKQMAAIKDFNPVYCNPNVQYDMELGIDTEYVSSYPETNKRNISLQLAVIGHDGLGQFRENVKDQGYFMINNSPEARYIKSLMIENGNGEFAAKYWKNDENLIIYDAKTKIGVYDQTKPEAKTPLGRVLEDTLGCDIVSRDAIQGTPTPYRILIGGFFLTVDIQALVECTGIEEVEGSVNSGRRLTVDRGANGRTKSFLETELFFKRDGEEFQVQLDLRDSSGVARSFKDLLEKANMGTTTKKSLDQYKSTMDVGFSQLPDEFVKYGMGDARDSHIGLVEHKKGAIKQFISDDNGNPSLKFLLVKRNAVDFSGDMDSIEKTVKALAENYGVFPETGGAIDNVLFENSVLKTVDKIIIEQGGTSLYDNLEWFKRCSNAIMRSLEHNRNKNELYKEVKRNGIASFEHTDMTNIVDAYLNLTQGGRFINMNPLGNTLGEAVSKSFKGRVEFTSIAKILIDQDLSSCYGKGMESTAIFFGDARIKYSIASEGHQNVVVLKKLLDRRDYKAFTDLMAQNGGITLGMFIQYIYNKKLLPQEGWLAVVSTKEELLYDQSFFVSKPVSNFVDHHTLPENVIEDNFINDSTTMKAMGNDATSMYLREIINSVINEGCMDFIGTMSCDQRDDFLSKVMVTSFDTYLKPDEKEYYRELMGSIISLAQQDVYALEHRKDGKNSDDAVKILNASIETANTGLVQNGVTRIYDYVNNYINACFSTTLGDLAITVLVQRRKKYKKLGKAHKDYYIQGILKEFINTFYGIQASVFFTSSNAIVGNNITMKPRVMTYMMERATISGSTITDGCIHRVDLFPDLEKIEEITGSPINPWNIVRELVVEEGVGRYRYPNIIGPRDSQGNYKEYEFPLTKKVMGHEILELRNHGELGGVQFQTLIVRDPNDNIILYSDLKYANEIFKDEPELLEILTESVGEDKYIIGSVDESIKSVTDFDSIWLKYIRKHFAHVMPEKFYKYEFERKMYFKGGDEVLQGGGDYRIKYPVIKGVGEIVVESLIRKRGGESNKVFKDHNGDVCEQSPAHELFNNIQNEDGSINEFVKLPKPKIKNGIAKTGYINTRKKKHNSHVKLGDGIAVVETGHMAIPAVKYRTKAIHDKVNLLLTNVQKDFGIGKCGVAIVKRDGVLVIDKERLNRLMVELSNAKDTDVVTTKFKTLRTIIGRTLKCVEYAEYVQELIETDKAACSFNGLKHDLKKWNKGRKIMIGFIQY